MHGVRPCMGICVRASARGRMTALGLAPGPEGCGGAPPAFVQAAQEAGKAAAPMPWEHANELRTCHAMKRGLVAYNSRCSILYERTYGCRSNCGRLLVGRFVVAGSSVTIETPALSLARGK